MNVLDIIKRGEAWLSEKPAGERSVIIRRRNIDGIRFSVSAAESPAGDKGITVRCVDDPGRNCLLTSQNWEVIGTCESFKEYREKVLDR